MGFALEAEFLHGHSQVNLGAVVVLNGRILATNQLNQFTALHTNALLALLGFADTGLNDFGYILLLQIVEVQLLNTRHLIIVKPIGRFQVDDL